MKRFSLLTSLLMAVSLVFATPVFAVAPSNDTYAGRTIVGSIPFSDSIDTTEATTDANDANAVGPCGPPVVDATVWYEITPASAGALRVDVSGSTYSAGVVIATGSPGTFAFVTCAPGTATFATVAGQTYTLLAFDFQADGGGNGGTLNITIAESPPPPVVNVSVNPVGQFDRDTGSATITGTVSCTGGATSAFISVELRQKKGKTEITGNGGSVSSCAETPQAWSAQVFPVTGRFKSGRATAVTFAQACSASGCGFDTDERVVKLHKARR